MFGAGIVGLSVRNILTNYIDQAQYATAFINNLVKNGMVTDKIYFQYTREILVIRLKQQLLKMWKVIVKAIREIYTLTPWDHSYKFSSKLTDSQFIELNKYNALQIASAFSVSSHNI